MTSFDDPISELALKELKELRCDLKEHAEGEEKRTKAIVRSAIKGAVITSGTIVGIVSAVLVAWSNVKQAEISQQTQLLMATQQRVEKDRPSTEQAMIDAYASGYRKARDEEKERNPPPIASAPEKVAARRR